MACPSSFAVCSASLFPLSWKLRRSDNVEPPGATQRLLGISRSIRRLLSLVARPAGHASEFMSPSNHGVIPYIHIYHAIVDIELELKLSQCGLAHAAISAASVMPQKFISNSRASNFLFPLYPSKFYTCKPPTSTAPPCLFYLRAIADLCPFTDDEKPACYYEYDSSSSSFSDSPFTGLQRSGCERRWEE